MTAKQSLPLLLFPILAIVPIAGCIRGGTEVSGESLPDSFPSLKLGAGSILAYGFGPPFADFVEVRREMTVVDSGGDGIAITTTYTHPTRPAFDSRIDATIASDGSLTRLDFPCEPTMFVEQNTECREHRGGYAQEVGHRGELFGLTLIAGLPIGENGEITRTMRFGTGSVQATFQARREGDALRVRAANDETRALEEYPQGGIEPFGCSLYNAEVTVSLESGLPISCVIHEDEEDAFGWILQESSVMDAPAWVVQPPAWDDGPRGPAGLPPRSPESSMPFGFWEALDALQNDTRSRNLFSDQPLWLGFSHLQFEGEYTVVATCPACPSLTTWEWTLGILGTKVSANAVVRKEILQCAADVVSVEEYQETAGTKPPATQARLAPIETFWANARESTEGIDPLAIVWDPPDPGELLYDLGQPYVFVGFEGAAEAKSALIPGVDMRPDGSIEWWQAKQVAPPSGACPAGEEGEGLDAA